VVTLFATGVLGVGSSSSGVSPTPTTIPVSASSLYSRVYKLVVKQLGPGYPNPQRLVALQLSTVRPEGQQPTTTEGGSALSDYRSLYIEYRLLDHPLRSWRLKTAKSEVFTLLKVLYTSGLPIYNVELDGQFMLPDHGKLREERALLAYIDHVTAGTIPWRTWGRDHEGQVWGILPFKSVDPRFA